MTSGIYAFFWALSLLRSIESLSTAERFPIRSYRRLLAWFLILYIFTILYSISHIGDSAGRAFSPVWVVVLALLLWGFLIHLLLTVHRAIGRLEPARQRRSAGAIVGLTLWFLSSLPVLQTEVDTLLARARTERGSGRSS
jgi:hypothetical protein